MPWIEATINDANAPNPVNDLGQFGTVANVYNGNTSGSGWYESGASATGTFYGDGYRIRQIDLSLTAADVQWIRVKGETRSLGTDPNSHKMNCAFSEGIELSSGNMSTTSTWAEWSITATPATWGLTSAEIDNLLSNSDSYYFTLTPEVTDRPNPYWVNMRYVTIEFDLPASSGGILLATL